MSFVPNPQKANAATGANSTATSNNAGTGVDGKTPAAAAAAGGATAEDDENSVFKYRTFDVLWVDRKALMYKDGLAKVFDKEARKATVTIKRKSSIPLILRDMAPPEGSTFDPAIKWEEEKDRRLKASTQEQQEKDEAAAASKGQKKKNVQKKSKGISAAAIQATNAMDKEKKDYERDLQKLGNLRSLKALQDAKCETVAGKVHLMMKMLHLAVSELKVGSVTSSEAEVFDILWALEEVPQFADSESLVTAEKAQKKKEKESEKKSSKKGGKDDKKKKKDKPSDKDDKASAEEKVVLTTEAKQLKQLLKEGGDARGSYKDSLKYARKLVSNKKDLISFQLTEMHDRLPPLSKYNRQFRLEEWQCDILSSIDKRQSAVVAAPTSSGKTLLSTYTCKKAEGTVLFILPSEVLVWQIAATYYDFFKGNVTICTEQITFQEITGDSQVYIGTPRALEVALTKARGIAAQEMVRGEKEFMVLDGGFHQFDYMVLDEVHTLNGPEGDALQRLIKANASCPCLALSATIGNATQLRDWFESIRQEVIKIIPAPKEESDAPKEPAPPVILKEHFARFINLQRWVVAESGDKHKLVKLHPIAAMTPQRMADEPDLISALSMTPTDMMDLWTRIKSMFPSTVLEDLDDPNVFFSGRVTLAQTKQYEVHLKKRLTKLSQSHSELYEKLRTSHLPPTESLKKKSDVSDDIYEVVKQLKDADVLPCVAFRLSTYGAFTMFQKLLGILEETQAKEFPNYRRDLIKMARDKAQMRKVAAGKASRENVAEAEEEAKAGFEAEGVNVSDDTTKPHDKFVLTAAAKRMSYNEVEDVIADMNKSGETVNIQHALIRGLRRGIAIYTNEVGFSCYRRQVQILAQKGRLAVVFSDDALAYGVNMPFRSCLFCGDMGDDLTPLIAQQMQGRAGRRGMDVQGNVIYMGMEWPYIENLMLGQISHVTGAPPRYPIMALQRAIAAANDPKDLAHFVHEFNEMAPQFADSLRKRERVKKCHPSVTDEAMQLMAGTTLDEFCRGETNETYLDNSMSVIEQLGFVDETMSLVDDHNSLSMVFELKEELPTALHIHAALKMLFHRFCFNKTKAFKESDSTQNELLSVMLHICDRVPCAEGDDSLQQLLRVEPSKDKSTPLNDDAMALWQETQKVLEKRDAFIRSLDCPEEDKKLMLLDTCKDIPLDRHVYEMLSSKQKGFPDHTSVEQRNSIKDRIVRMGQICLVCHNNIQQPHGHYAALEVHFRRLFGNIKYSVADMMNQLTDQADKTEV